MKFVETFKKQGGMNLVKQYWKAGVLWYAVCQMLILGRDKMSLELLRNGVTMKVFKTLQKRYKSVLKNFDQHYSNATLPTSKSKKVWVCWMQGMEQAPELVKKCYQSLQKNLIGRDIVLITSENLSQYTEFPEWILEKYRKGLITHTHFSDLLRVELLCRHGGTWIDATVFCSGQDIPDYMLDSDLFLFQKLKPGADGNAIRISSWFMTACSNNKVLLAVRELLWQYWKKENSLIDYFLLHHFVMMALNFYEDDCKRIVQYSNSIPHILLLMLFDDFNQEKWDAVTVICPFHKLAYKRNAEDFAKQGTFYQHIMGL